MDELFDAIKCVNCRNVLNSPVILPCGCSICQKHTHDLITGSPILCSLCEIEHTLPPNGYFTPNTYLEQILEAKIGSLNFGQEHIKAKQSCSRLDELLTQIEQILNDPFNFIYEAIEYLKQVSLEKFEEDENRALLFAQLDKFKACCKRYLRSRKYLSTANSLEKRKENTRQELEKWEATLNELKINKFRWERIKSECEMIIKSLEIELEKFKIEKLLQKRFEIYRAKIENKYGKFQIDSRFKFRYFKVKLTNK